MGLSDIIDVDISISASSPKAVAFNTPLIVAKAPFAAGTARLYSANPSGLSAMVTDGFATYSRAYQQAAAAVAVEGGAGRFYVWSRTAQCTHIVDLTVDISKTVVGSVISFDLSYQGVTSTISVTVVTDTVNDILDLIEAAIDASPAGVAGIGVAPDNATATKLTLTADVAGDFFQIDGAGAEIVLTDVSVDGSMAANLTAAQVALGESFYGLLIDSYCEAEINLAASFAESNNKLFMGLAIDDEIVTDTSSPDDVVTDQLARNRTGVYFTRQPSAEDAASHLFKMLGTVPGAQSWRHKVLTGTADVLSDTEFANLTAKRGLSYTSKRGLALTDSGRAGSGRPFDLTHGADQLKADIETSVLQMFANAPKVPFNNKGRAMVRAAISGPLAAAQAAGFVEPGWFVEIPEIADISDADKAARILRNCTFSAVLTGAIESAVLAGTLTLSA